MNAKEILNKIKWDSSEEPEKCFVFYLDRISGGLKKVEFRKIKNIEGNFFEIEENGKITEIPIHRIREVRRENKLVWRRGL